MDIRRRPNEFYAKLSNQTWPGLFASHLVALELASLSRFEWLQIGGQAELATFRLISLPSAALISNSVVANRREIIIRLSVNLIELNWIEIESNELNCTELNCVLCVAVSGRLVGLAKVHLFERDI